MPHAEPSRSRDENRFAKVSVGSHRSGDAERRPVFVGRIWRAEVSGC